MHIRECIVALDDVCEDASLSDEGHRFEMGRVLQDEAAGVREHRTRRMDAIVRREYDMVRITHGVGVLVRRVVV